MCVGGGGDEDEARPKPNEMCNSARVSPGSGPVLLIKAWGFKERKRERETPL